MATQTRSELDDLKTRVDLAELIRGAGIELKIVGKNLLGRCPFHDDQTASLSVNPKSGCGIVSRVMPAATSSAFSS